MRLKTHEGVIYHPSWDLLTFYRRIKDLNRVSQVVLVVKSPPVKAEDPREMLVPSLGREDPLE